MDVSSARCSAAFGPVNRSSLWWNQEMISILFYSYSSLMSGPMLSLSFISSSSVRLGLFVSIRSITSRHFLRNEAFRLDHSCFFRAFLIHQSIEWTGAEMYTAPLLLNCFTTTKQRKNVAVFEYKNWETDGQSQKYTEAVSSLPQVQTVQFQSISPSLLTDEKIIEKIACISEKGMRYLVSTSFPV